MIKLTKGCHWHKKLDNPILELWHPMFRSSTSIVYLKVNYYTIIMVLLIMFEMQKLDQAWEQNRGSWAELLILQAHLRLFLCKPWLKCRLSCLVGCIIAWDSCRAHIFHCYGNAWQFKNSPQASLCELSLSSTRLYFLLFFICRVQKQDETREWSS